MVSSGSLASPCPDVDVDVSVRPPKARMDALFEEQLNNTEEM